jgi:peptide/nickel transport system permease protein
VGSAILVEAGLSFLGLGDRSVVSWGNMLNNAQPLIRIAWWTAVFPGLAITLAVVTANLMADGLNAALDPRLRRNVPPS